MFRNLPPVRYIALLTAAGIALSLALGLVAGAALELTGNGYMKAPVSLRSTH